MLARYGFMPTDAEISRMISDIRQGRALFMMHRHKDPEWRNIYRVEVRGIKLYVVYNAKYNSIQTVLPKCAKQIDDRLAELAWIGKELE